MWGAGPVYEGIWGIGDRLNICTTLFPHEQAGSQTPREQEEKNVINAYNLPRCTQGEQSEVLAAFKTERTCRK